KGIPNFHICQPPSSVPRSSLSRSNARKLHGFATRPPPPLVQSPTLRDDVACTVAVLPRRRPLVLHLRPWHRADLPPAFAHAVTVLLCLRPLPSVSSSTGD
ncbi:hypothetical protein PIB30_103740, partial [Stylosanthes scabra]|nr:hypothetical protein [Stylosanthes scabra]